MLCILFALILINYVHVAQAFLSLKNRFNALKTIRCSVLEAGLSKSIEDSLREKFQQTMISNNSRLFSSWSNYERSLPRRKYDMKGIPSYLPLYTLDYYVQDKNLQEFANEIRKPSSKANAQIRTAVKYITAPSCSGKTSSILPAFLRTDLSHYIYIAFDNNEHNNYRLLQSDVQMSRDDDIAYNQGADFIFNCVKCYLDSPLPGPHRIKCNPNPPEYQETQRVLEIYLREKLGDNHMCLFHLDEHRKMCPRFLDDGTGKDFSRGAMQLLAEISRAVVVATYTDLPLIPSRGSSGICRVPIRLPILDINKVMKVILELSVVKIPRKASRRFLRKLATLKLRLSAKIRQLGITSVLHRRNDCPETETFLAAFFQQSSSATTSSSSSSDNDDEEVEMEAALEACTQLCQFDCAVAVKKVDDNAALLLMGIADSEREFYRQLPQQELLLVSGGLLTTSLECLLARSDPNVVVYNSGRSIFSNVLMAEDYLSSTPLEAAYIWTLSTKSALEGSLQFYKSCFTIKCDELVRARLFPGDDSSGTINTNFLRENILYFAEERNGRPTHPLADIFFITKQKQLVLVDVAGGDARKVLQKRKNLIAWIAENGGCVNGLTLHAVVLAPHDVSGQSSSVVVPNTTNSNVEVVRGMDARLFLAGLDQIFEWLEPQEQGFI